ncbi:MAG: hypothetical protein QW816_04070 [Desulfurococcaceae archaeon]
MPFTYTSFGFTRTFQKRYTVQLSKWEMQKHAALVVVEKEAQYEAIHKMLNVDLAWDVSVTTSRGFESATANSRLPHYPSSPVFLN